MSNAFTAMQKKLGALIEQKKKQAFIPDYQAKATDEEALGILISQHFEWDGLAILRTCHSALEDANFHRESDVVDRLIDFVEARKKPDAESLKPMQSPFSFKLFLRSLFPFLF